MRRLRLHEVVAYEVDEHAYEADLVCISKGWTILDSWGMSLEEREFHFGGDRYVACGDPKSTPTCIRCGTFINYGRRCDICKRRLECTASPDWCVRLYPLDNTGDESLDLRLCDECKASHMNFNC